MFLRSRSKSTFVTASPFTRASTSGNTAGIGDLVLINETRPLSATKRWRLVEILEKAK